jgi:nickel-dependent lactate racemase
VTDQPRSSTSEYRKGPSRGSGYIFVRGRRIDFDVPPGWDIIYQAAPRVAPVEGKTPAELLLSSLRNPVGSVRISDLARPKSRVAIMVDDDTRPTPIRELLPLVLQELRACGVPRHNIDIVVAVGTHPPLEANKLRKRLGDEILSHYRVTNHNSWAEDLFDLCTIGGIEVRVNAIVAQADLKIGIGSVLPHPFAGFGGGPKIAMPGVCGYDTIREHHTSTLLEGDSYLGRIEGNPFYDFICQTSEFLGLDYVVDCVVDAEGQVVEIISGHPIEAHRVGVEVCRKIYGVEVLEEADITISSAYPHEEGPQIIKAILPAVMSTRKGGVLILVAACEGGLPEPFLQMFDLVRNQRPEDPLQTVVEHMRSRKAFVPDSSMDFNCAVQVNFACLRHVQVILVSENVTPEQAARMGFSHEPDLPTALAIAHELHPEARVNVFAAGGIALPLVEKEIDLFGVGLPSLD